MKIRFESLGIVPPEQIEANKRYANGLGLPDIRGAFSGNLAIVGGGKSAAGRLDEIRAFPGDIWAINGAWRWLSEHGIDATFYTIDPTPVDCPGVTSAVLGSSVDPSVFDALKGAASVWLADIDDGFTWATSASTGAALAVMAGYETVSFFGCEASFDGQTHAYGDVSGSRIVVRCGGADYLTTPAYFMQTELLAELIRAAPDTFKDCSGGLLGAMSAHDWDIVAGSPCVAQALELTTNDDQPGY